MNKKENTWELIKFLITGAVCALADYAVSTIFLKILENKGIPDTGVSAISLLAGFIIGVILNYILSTFWVFKGKQDKGVTKSTKFIVLFVIFSAIAYGLSYGTYELFRYVFNSNAHVNINECTVGYILKFTFWGDQLFWFFTLAFVVKTLVGLIWNYFTRKYFLYKRKPEQEEVAE